MRGANSTPGSAAITRRSCKCRRLPAVAQLPQRREIPRAAPGSRCRARAAPPQPLGDDFGAVEPEKHIDLSLLPSVMTGMASPRGSRSAARSCSRAAAFEGSRSSVKSRLRSRYSCPGNTRVAVRQPRQALAEALVQQLRITAVNAVAGAGVEQRIAGEQRRRLLAPAPRAYRHRCARVWPGVSRHASSTERPMRTRSPSRRPCVDAADALGRGRVRQHLRAGRRDHRGVAAGVVPCSWVLKIWRMRQPSSRARPDRPRR